VAVAKPKRRWFLRPLWRDPSFYFDFIVAAALYGLMFPFLWSRATSLVAQVAVVAYFFVIWLLIAAIVSIPIGSIRGYWRGQEESDRRQADPEQTLTTAQAAVRVSGRVVGRYLAKRKHP
jgi:hypothetical protein